MTETNEGPAAYTVETTVRVWHGDTLWSETPHRQFFEDRDDLEAYELALVDALRGMWARLQEAGRAARGAVSGGGPRR